MCCIVRQLSSKVAWGIVFSCALLVSGCVVMLDGAGKAGIGYRSETTLFGFHEVDGDKEGKESKSELDVDPVLKSLIGGTPPVSDDRGSDEESVGADGSSTESG